MDSGLKIMGKNQIIILKRFLSPWPMMEKRAGFLNWFVRDIQRVLFLIGCCCWKMQPWIETPVILQSVKKGMSTLVGITVSHTWESMDKKSCKVVGTLTPLWGNIYHVQRSTRSRQFGLNKIISSLFGFLLPTLVTQMQQAIGMEPGKVVIINATLAMLKQIN